jgi:hypothetical protein
MDALGQLKFENWSSSEKAAYKKEMEELSAESGNGSIN